MNNRTTTEPTVTYPRIVWIHIAESPGYKSVMVADKEAEKALGVPVFTDAEHAGAFMPSVEQPISHIARTNNEEQFVPGRSQAGAEISKGVIVTPPPVSMIFVKTGVDPATLALKVAAEGTDPKTLTDALEGGGVLKSI
jgi:hypothetical protein